MSNAVHSKNFSILLGTTSYQLVVYKNKSEFKEKQDAFEEGAFVGGFGTSKKKLSWSSTLTSMENAIIGKLIGAVIDSPISSDFVLAIRELAWHLKSKKAI